MPIQTQRSSAETEELLPFETWPKPHQKIVSERDFLKKADKDNRDFASATEVREIGQKYAKKSFQPQKYSAEKTYNPLRQVHNIF